MGQTSTTSYLKNQISTLVFSLAFLLPALSQLQVTVTVTGTDVTCNGAHNGTATANPSGG